MTRKLAAEVVGTFALVFLAVGAAVTGISSLGGVGVALGFGLVLTFLVFAIGPVSGAHVNPAVTLAM
ncbi:MAG TPA: aquaporin, partial [Actinomycetes bacterium]|nr:aquaporin [Actinomycetes bacterium]